MPVESLIVNFLVSPIIKEVLSKITSLIGNSVGDVKKVLLGLKNSLMGIQSLLEIAEELQESHPEIIERLRDLEGVAYDAEDLLDEHQQKQVRRSFSDFLKLFFVKKAKAVKERLDECAKGLEGQIKNINQLNQVRQLPNQTQSFLDNLQVSERVNDVKTVEMSLAELRSPNRLSGVCIVGMPGVGKTTVARSVYQNAVEKQSYDLVFWVSVATKVDALRQMLEHFDGSAFERTNNVALVEKLKKEVKGKSFLLILDDVQSAEADPYCKFICKLSGILRTTGQSSIVVTTNSKHVASAMQAMRGVPMHRHELQTLSKEECWSIIEKIVLESSEITLLPSDLLAVGNEIAKQCGGLPLVASVIGEKLGKNVNKECWEAIKKDDGARDSPHRKMILTELKRSSYDRLSSSVKKCFAYCSVFPKGWEYRRDELVQLWLAAGFLGQEEDVGYTYWDELESSYLLEVVELDVCENSKSCKMHDEVHNLASLVSEHETFIWSSTPPPNENSSIRQMRVMSDANLRKIPGNAFERLHSLFLEKNVSNSEAAKKVSRRLRSLSVVAKSKKELQASLGNSKYVKYLNISDSRAKKLPKAVSKFYNLQTLRYDGCNLLNLPTSITEDLVSLRHIFFKDERHMPTRIGKLTSLQTLPLFVVGTEEGRRIAELGGLKHLGGELKICNLEQVPVFEATGAQLEDKVNLFSLHLVWSRDRANDNGDEDVLKRLRPNSNLKSLTLENYKGKGFPRWMEEMNAISSAFHLNCLVKLEFIHCDECKNIPHVGILPKLKILIVKGMREVIKMGSKFSDIRSNIASSSQDGGGQPIKLFPSLRKLELYDMEKMEEWIEAEDVAVFPCLEELHISNCPMLQTWQMNGSTSLELSKVSIHSCQDLGTLPNMLKINFLEIKSCPKLSQYDWTKMDEITIDGQVVKS